MVRQNKLACWSLAIFGLSKICEYSCDINLSGKELVINI
jgi:hypothetical protein